MKIRNQYGCPVVSDDYKEVTAVPSLTRHWHFGESPWAKSVVWGLLGKTENASLFKWLPPDVTKAPNTTSNIQILTNMLGLSVNGSKRQGNCSWGKHSLSMLRSRAFLMKAVYYVDRSFIHRCKRPNFVLGVLTISVLSLFNWEFGKV